jgi:hypothetical protein
MTSTTSKPDYTAANTKRLTFSVAEIATMMAIAHFEGKDPSEKEVDAYTDEKINFLMGIEQPE